VAEPKVTGAGVTAAGRIATGAGVTAASRVATGPAAVGKLARSAPAGMMAMTTMEGEMTGGGL
jgi:hypothetical protein